MYIIIKLVCLDNRDYFVTVPIYQILCPRSSSNRKRSLFGCTLVLLVRRHKSGLCAAARDGRVHYRDRGVAGCKRREPSFSRQPRDNNARVKLHAALNCGRCQQVQCDRQVNQ